MDNVFEEDFSVEKDGYDEMVDELSVLIQKARMANEKYKLVGKELKAIKEDLRIFMIDSGIKKHAGVEIRRGFSFDREAMRLEHPKIAEAYFVIEEIITVNHNLTKKNQEKIREQHPDIYRKYISEKTPAVYGL